MAEYPLEPFRIKVIERVRRTTPEERRAHLEEAGWNVFRLRSEDVLIDLLTDSGTGAMSDEQWAGLMTGDEAYAGSRSYYRLVETVRDLFGFEHVVPTHQGRAAEAILFELLVQPGQTVPNTMHFDTTEAHVLARGGLPVNLPVPAAQLPQSRAPFKGDIDLARLRRLLEDPASQVPLIMLTMTNNTAGGHPVSLENLRRARALADEFGIPLFLDAARFAENAWFITQRDPVSAGRPVREVVREVFGLADGFTLSAKKDGLVNIGGLLGVRDPALFEQIQVQLVLREGFPTYGGLAGRDLEAMARGLVEATDEDYLRYRVGQVAYLADRLRAEGVPIVEPPGGHAVYLDMKRFLPQIPAERFPGVALVAELYLRAGIRAVELGGLAFGRTDPQTGQAVWPVLDLVRLAIPRRVYTQAHLDAVGEAVTDLWRDREQLTGMELLWQAEHLRHFTARLRPLPSIERRVPRAA